MCWSKVWSKLWSCWINLIWISFFFCTNEKKCLICVNWRNYRKLHISGEIWSFCKIWFLFLCYSKIVFWHGKPRTRVFNWIWNTRFLCLFTFSCICWMLTKSAYLQGFISNVFTFPVRNCEVTLVPWCEFISFPTSQNIMNIKRCIEMNKEHRGLM